MAALDMRGEHRVNTILRQKEREREKKKEGFCENASVPRLLCPRLGSLLAKATSQLEQVNRTTSTRPMVKQCDAKPGPLR